MATWVRWDTEQIAMLRALYPTTTAGSIASQVGHTASAVRRRAAILGLTKAGGRYQRLHDHYTVWPAAFHDLNPDTAYVLGLILADGSVSGDLLKITNNSLTLMAEIRRILRTDHRIVPARAARDRTYSITFRSALVNDLRRYGITANKSLTARWPALIPPAMFGSCLRGYFDGDGSARYSQRGGLQLKFTSGSQLLLADLARELANRGLPAKQVVHDRGRPNANRLYYSGPSAAQIGTIMYAVPGFSLAVKREPFARYASR